jgi:quercetin dioxygenase-like cupin family protein
MSWHRRSKPTTRNPKLLYNTRMLIRRADTIPGQPMEMDGVKGVTMRLLVGRADGAPNFAMRHFTVEPGGHTPRHSHNYEHEVIVLAGRAKVEENGEFHEIAPGDVLYVAPNVTHQFTNTSEAPFQFICLVPTTFDCGKATPGS